MYGGNFFTTGNSFSMHTGNHLPKVIGITNNPSGLNGIVLPQASTTFSYAFLQVCQNSNQNAEKSSLLLLDKLESTTSNTIANNTNSLLLYSFLQTSSFTIIAGTGQQNFIGNIYTVPQQATSVNLSTIGFIVVNNSNVYIVDNRDSLILQISNGNISIFAGGYSPIIPSNSGVGASIYSYYNGGTALTSSLNNPCGIVFDDQGNMYVADSNNNVIRVVVSGGTMLTIAGNASGTTTAGNQGYTGDEGLATSATLNRPFAVAFEIYQNVGYLYISDTGNNVIRQLNLSTQIITTIVGNGSSGYSGDKGQAKTANLNIPSYLIVNNHNLYFSDSGNNVIRKVDLSTRIITTIAGNGSAFLYGFGNDPTTNQPLTTCLATNAYLSNPQGLALYNNNLYVSSSGYNDIWRIDLTTNLVTALGISGLNLPTGITINNGNLYICDQNNYRIIIQNL